MHEKVVQLILDKPKLGILTSGSVTAAGLISLIETATKIGGLIIVLIGLMAAWYNLKVQKSAAEKIEKESQI
jgi:hypothetical protein